MRAVSRQCQSETKSKVAHALVRIEPVAHTSAHILRPMVPGASAKHALCAVTFPASIRPLPDIPHHVIQTPGIRLEAAYRRGFFIVPFASATIAISVITPDIVSPVISGGGAGAGG